MIAREDIFKLRKQINDHVGQTVRIRAHKGRKKVTVNEGVIQSTYPSIFIVQVENHGEHTFRNVSYSYTDLLTHNVELSLCND